MDGSEIINNALKLVSHMSGRSGRLDRVGSMEGGDQSAGGSNGCVSPPSMALHEKSPHLTVTTVRYHCSYHYH